MFVPQTLYQHWIERIVHIYCVPKLLKLFNILFHAKEGSVGPMQCVWKRVGVNSIHCTTCGYWVHGWCSGVRGRLTRVAQSFVYKMYRGGGREAADEFRFKDVELECVGEFVYWAICWMIQVGWNKPELLGWGQHGWSLESLVKYCVHEGLLWGWKVLCIILRMLWKSIKVFWQARNKSVTKLQRLVNFLQFISWLQKITII